MTDIREQFIKSALSKCRHFNGIQNKSCKAGVSYEKAEDGDNTMIPCIPKHISAEHPAWSCDLFQIMSQSEAEQDADSRLVVMNRGILIRNAAHNDAKVRGYRRGNGGYGSVPCPACGGTIRYSVAGLNGHMHGACSTLGCASWME